MLLLRSPRTTVFSISPVFLLVPGVDLPEPRPHDVAPLVNVEVLEEVFLDEVEHATVLVLGVQIGQEGLRVIVEVVELVFVLALVAQHSVVRFVHELVPLLTVALTEAETKISVNVRAEVVTSGPKFDDN